MDNELFYMSIISKCEDMVLGCKGRKPGIKDVIEIISSYEAELEEFALRHERFGVLGLSIQPPEDVYQIASHYLDDMPKLQKQVAKALHNNLYKTDYFLSETDTLIAKDKISINLCTHSAYGIDTIRNPLWSVCWNIKRHNQIVKEFKRLGFKTGDVIGIDIDSEEKPTVYRL
jgi:hypothetical protein